MSAWAVAAPSAHNGVIDLRGWDFERDGAVNLAGSWGLSWDRFDDPTSSASGTLAVPVPGHWNDVDVGGRRAGADGHASYHLTVLCDRAGGLAMSIVSREESDVLDGQIGGRPGVSKHATIEDIVARIQAVMAR